jgi:hypothetical protein
MARSNPVDQRQLIAQMLEESFRLPNWNETSLRSDLIKAMYCRSQAAT